MMTYNGFFKKLCSALLVLTLVFTLLPQGAVETQAATRLESAKSKHNVTDDRVLKVSTVTQLRKALTQAAENATSDSRWIVYAKPGTYSVMVRITVPENVILVGTDETIFTPERSMTQLVIMNGSIYGGTYDCAGLAKYGIRTADGVSYDGGANSDTGNGWISCANIKNATMSGIVCVNKTSDVYIYRCDCTNNGTYGISIKKNGAISEIYGCTLTGNTLSGLYFTNATVGTIAECTISSNGESGIETGKNVTITKIKGNTIKSNGEDGVLLASSTDVTSFNENTIARNEQFGLEVLDGSDVAAMSDNILSKNGTTNLYIAGSSARVVIKDGNSIIKAGTNNVTMNDGATLIVKGSNNSFNSAASIGLSLRGGSTLNMKSGSNNLVQNNGDYGIKLAGGSTATLLNTDFGGNGTYAGQINRYGEITSFEGCEYTTTDKTSEYYFHYNVPFEQAAEVLDEIGWDLQAAFDWSAGMTYYGHNSEVPSYPDDEHTAEWYANYGFENYKGNCIVMAMTFYQMAKDMGYEVRCIYGGCQDWGGINPHGWTEIDIDGETYVFDPNFTNETGRNGYQITYGQSGTWVYVKDYVFAE